MLVRPSQKVDRRIANEQDRVVKNRIVVIGQRSEVRSQTALRQQHSEQTHARERRRVAKHLRHLLQWLAMRQKYAFHLAQRSDGNAVEHVVTVAKEYFRHAE